MHWKINILLLVLLIMGCKTDPKKSTVVLAEGALIEPVELAAHLGEEGLKIIDVRNVSAFEKGHIPGALQVDRSALENKTVQIPGMRADAMEMEQLLSKMGIETEDWLVLYDDRGNPEAARLWCVLKGYGKDRIKLLNGGLKAWKEAGYELITEHEVPLPSTFSWKDVKPENIWIEANYIADKLQDPSSKLVLIDTRTSEEYHGIRQKNNAMRAGHIPGAIHLDWADLIDYHGNHRLKQKEKIRSQLLKFGLTPEDSIVLYCHSGVRSSLSTFVMREIMEYPNVWNYDGSWTEWSRLEHYPIVVDSITTIFN